MFVCRPGLVLALRKLRFPPVRGVPFSDTAQQGSEIVPNNSPKVIRIKLSLRAVRARFRLPGRFRRRRPTVWNYQRPTNRKFSDLHFQCVLAHTCAVFQGGFLLLVLASFSHSTVSIPALRREE